MVLDAGSSSAEDIVVRSMICCKTIRAANAQVLGLVLNQVGHMSITAAKLNNPHSPSSPSVFTCKWRKLGTSCC